SVMKLFILACMPAIVAACSKGNTWLDGRCFSVTQFDDPGTSFISSYFFCDLRGARLPVIKSETEEKQFMAAVEKQFADGFSFYLALRCDGHNYVWPDGSLANYTNFSAFKISNTPLSKKSYAYLWLILASRENTFFSFVVLVINIRNAHLKKND
ncbi:hypothetical protein PFISCL1PPCAC_3473, partial [Pristionchus fissidentatus]